MDIVGVADFDKSMDRIDAWYQNQILDRAPIRFMAHNAFLQQASEDISSLSPADRKAWWFDVETQVELFARSIQGRRFFGETFPVFFPNLGPEVYAAFYGAELVFGEVTSWSVPLIRDWQDIDRLQFDRDNIYFRKLEELTACALERSQGRFMVGYTDLHPGIDCAASWRDPQQLCLDLFDAPEQVKRLAQIAIADFTEIYDHFDAILKRAGQLSVSWMGLPSRGKMHIPCCDFSSMISPAFFKEFVLPVHRQELGGMTHNVYHVDGKGVARHLDDIIELGDIHAVQWVQGVGDDQPIMQWLPLIKRLQERQMPVIVDLNKKELPRFIEAISPEGIFLWVAADDEEEEQRLLKLVEGWR